MEIEGYIVSTDQQLVDMSLEGDKAAFEYLFKRYRDPIMQMYMYRTGSVREDADDLLQETFIKVYLSLHKYNPEYTFGQWIYTIARNTFIDYVRKRRDDLSLDGIPEGFRGIAPASSAPNPEECVINSQKRAQLEGYLAGMSPGYRKLIELRFFRDYSYEEIAAELKMPMGSVKTRIHRARAQLCKMIIESSDILP